MLINNPLKMNEWKINKFLFSVLVIQFAFIGSIFLETIFQIPVLRQFLGFIYLTFVPGILILRIMRLHGLDNIETVLYSVGLSIATLMFFGFFINIFFPLVSIKNPISFIPLILSINILTLILCVFSYLRDKNFKKTSLVDTNLIFSNSTILLGLIPFLAILGTYAMNSYRNPIFSMILIVLIGIIFVLSGYNKISSKFYPFVIFIVSISLLYDTSLISNNLWGWDSQIEYGVAHSVILSSFWNRIYLEM